MRRARPAEGCGGLPRQGATGGVLSWGRALPPSTALEKRMGEGEAAAGGPLPLPLPGGGFKI